MAVCGLGFLGFNAFAQDVDLFLEDAKVHYLIEIAKHTEWPNDAEIERFRVAVLSSEEDLVAAFRDREPVRVRGKDMAFTYLESDEFEPREFDLIFLGRRFRGLNDDLFTSTESTLIVVDGRVTRDQQMVSLMSQGSQISIQIHRDNLVQRGFHPSINLLEFAGTKEELTDELRESESRLEDLAAEVESKEARVAKLNAELASNSAHLAAAQQTLSEKEQELEESQSQLQTLAGQIESARSEVAKYRAQIEEQQALFASTQAEIQANQEEIQAKQAEIEEKEQAIDGLQEEIDENQEVLDRQLVRIDEQRSMLDEKSETIAVLQNQMIVILGVFVIFAVMVFFLLRLNGLRKKANRELETLNSQLYELATTDSMTGLSNRRHFFELAQKQLLHHQRNDQELTVLMLDVDRFKAVNDNYGHAAGDRVIEGVGQLLSKNLREYDLVGRLGGEEYGMLLVDCDDQQSMEIASRICTDVADAEFTFEEQTIQVTISIGIGRMKRGDRDIEQPLARADKALLQAKEAGRNRVVAYAEG